MNVLTGMASLRAVIASSASIEVALEPVQLFEGTGKGGSEVDSRSAVQPLCLD
jgi:hypothetical protein